MSAIRPLAFTILAAALAVGSSAAPPEGKGGGGGGKGGKDDAADFQPEILYQYNGRKSQDVRLTDIDASSFVTVHAAEPAQLDGFAASDEEYAMIAYAEAGDIYLTNWTASPVEIGAKSLISARDDRAPGSGRVHWMDFSPDGTRLVFTESSAEPNNLGSDAERRLWVYEIGSQTLSLVLWNFSILDVAWSPVKDEDDVVYFTGGAVGLNYPEHLFRFDMATGDLDPVLTYGIDYTSRYFDITGKHAAGSPKIAMAFKEADGRDYIRIYDLAGNRLYSDWMSRGDILNFDCSGTRLIGKDEGSTGANLTITQVGGTATGFVSGRGYHSVSDWMPRNPC